MDGQGERGSCDRVLARCSTTLQLEEANANWFNHNVIGGLKSICFRGKTSPGKASPLVSLHHTCRLLVSVLYPPTNTKHPHQREEEEEEIVLGRFVQPLTLPYFSNSLSINSSSSPLETLRTVRRILGCTRLHYLLLWFY